MWQAGSFGAVHAVGLPAPNRSHFAAMEEIEYADPGSSARVGWINRAVGLNTSAVSETAVQLVRRCCQLRWPVRPLGWASVPCRT